jgi:hypothetical protein
MLTLKPKFRELLKFDEKAHKYVLNENVIGSVTQIINNFIPETNFNDWYKSLGNNYAKENNLELEPEEALLIGKKIGNTIKTQVGNNGKKVHRILEDYYLGKVSGDKLDRFVNLPKYFDVEYDSNNCPFVENIVYNENPYPYAGTVDSVMFTKTNTDYWDRGERLVVDYKNPRKSKSIIMKKRDGSEYYPFIQYAIQLSAYNEAISYLYNERIDKALVILAPQDRKGLTYVYFGKDELLHYFQYFSLMLKNYYNHSPFSWDFLEDESYCLGYLGAKVNGL